MFGGLWPSVLVTPLVLLVLASPLFYSARKAGRADTVRRFLIGGAAIATLVVILNLVSERNVQQCLDAGNPSCVDGGTTGMQLIFIFGYVVTAWWVAWTVAKG